jgi:hypothetical protein
VYFPVINQICDVAAFGSIGGAMAGCTAKVDRATASLDGKPLEVVQATSKRPFTFTVQPHSSSGLAPGDHRAVAWGRWVGPIALARGTHNLRFGAAAGAFSLDVRYTLEVR